MTKKLPIYFSDQAWLTLQKIMGANGKPSPTINALLESTVHQRFVPVQAQTTAAIPLVQDRIYAGFPSPAQDFIEDCIDLNQMLILNEPSTFMGEVGSNSMINAGIGFGDKIIVDRSLNAVNGDIVVSLIDNEFTVKRLIITPKETYLKAENPDYPDIHFNEGQELLVWGVVTSVIKQFRKRAK